MRFIIDNYFPSLLFFIFFVFYFFDSICFCFIQIILRISKYFIKVITSYYKLFIKGFNPLVCLVSKCGNYNKLLKFITSLIKSLKMWISCFSLELRSSITRNLVIYSHSFYNCMRQCAIIYHLSLCFIIFTTSHSLLKFPTIFEIMVRLLNYTSFHIDYFFRFFI